MKRVLLQLVLLFVIGTNAIAQTHTVTGKVMDEHGQPLKGTDVSVMGANVGTTTDENGDWMLEVPDGKMFYFVEASGYNSRTIEDSSQFILIQLQLASKEQEGDFTGVFGLNRDRRELGYTAATLNNEELQSGGNVSAIAGMAGKVADADISTNGGYGASTNIVMRGLRSFIQSSNPIIVVDGVITNNFQRTSSSQGISNIYNQVDFGNSINDINPEDIASVSILEGANAATLYGSAGANGAVIITTKSGAGGKKKMEITYKMDVSQFHILNVPDVQHTYGQGDIYSGLTDYRATNYSWGLTMDNELRPWGQIINGKQLVKPYSDQANNIKDFFNTSDALSNYAAVKGGGEHSTYFLSLNAINSQSVVPNDFYNRYNVRFNGTMDLSNHFYSAVNFNYMNSYSRSEYEGDGGATNTGGIMETVLNTPRDIPLWELSDLNNKFYSMNYIDTAGNHRYGNYSSKFTNPYWAASNFDNRNNSDRLTGSVKLGYKNGEFDVFNRVGLDYNSDMNTFKTPWFVVTAADQSGLYPGTAYAGTGFNSNGGYAQAQVTNLRFYDDLIGTYSHPIDRDFGMNLMAGSSVSMMRDAVLNSSINPVTSGLVIPDYYNFNNNSGAITSANLLTEHRTFGMFGEARFNYQREFFLDITGRVDWSSAFDYSQPHYYPGINGSWIFTERMKGWLKDKVLNYGKLRMGVAGAGNDAVPYANNNAGYSQLPIASSNGTITTPFNTLPVYQVQNTFGDQNLRPELTTEYETGMDLSFFKDKVSFGFTYYNSYTYNVIAAMPIAPSSGFTYNFQNVGDVTNKGEEITLRVTPIKTKYGLKWDIFGAYNHNVNNVESIANTNDNIVLGGADGIEMVAAKDHPLGTFYGYDIAYWQNPKDGSWHPIVDPSTGLPVASSKPVYMGSYQPKYLLSWGTDVSWGGIKLHFLFTSKQGGQFFSQEKELMDVNGTATETTVNERKPLLWSSNAVNQVGTTNNYVANTTKYLPYNYFVNEIGANKLPGQNLVDASYIKLQEVSLSYRVPQKYYARSIFGSLEGGIYGNNLVEWLPASNHYGDPDVAMANLMGNNTGINYSQRPSVKSYGVFVKMTF